MLKKLIDNLNNILTKAVLILHVSEKMSIIKSASLVKYTIYLKEKNAEPVEIYFSFGIKKIGGDNKNIELQVINEFLKLVVEGELKKYE